MCVKVQMFVIGEKKRALFVDKLYAEEKKEVQVPSIEPL